MDNDSENTLIPDSLEESIPEDSDISLPDSKGHLLEALQHISSEDVLDTRKIFAAMRTMALSEANKAVHIFVRSLKVNPPYWERRVPMVSALGHLDFLSMLDVDAVRQDSDILSYCIILNYALERYPLVLEYNQYLQHADPTDITRGFRSLISIMVSVSEDKLSLPVPFMDYRTRTQKGWAANTAALGKLYKHKLPSDKLADSLLPLKAHVGIDAQVVPPTGHLSKCSIVFKPEPIETDFYPMLYVAEHMPEDLRDRVEVTCEAPQLSWAEILDVLDDYPALQGMRLTLLDTRDHTGVFLDAYGPGLRELEEDEEDPTEAALTNILIRFLGYYTWRMDIYSISIDTESAVPDDAISLKQLPQALEDLGYSLDISREDVEERLHRMYTGTPSDSTALRWDILTGETNCYRLQEEYQDGRTDTADHLINLGVVPCFLAWPKSIIPDDEKSFCERLLAYLMVAGVSPLFKVVGAASGSQYFYLDLLAWSLPGLIQHVESFFSQFPGGDQVLLQGFRHGSKPVPATLSAIGYHLKTPSETGAAAGTRQAGSQKPANGKEKNKGKSKEKNKGKKHKK